MPQAGAGSMTEASSFALARNRNLLFLKLSFILEPTSCTKVIGLVMWTTHSETYPWTGGKSHDEIRAGSGCLNNNSASISGASAGVRPPRGAEENRSRLDPGCGRQGSNAVVARCKSRDIDQSSFAPHRRFRRLADRPPRI